MQFSNSQLNLNDLPNIEDIIYYPVEEKYVKVLYLRFIFLWGIPFLISLMLSFLAKEYKWTLLGVSIFFLFLLITMLFLTKRIYEFRGYALRENDICQKRGIIFNKYASVPFRRVQHITVEQSLFERWFNLASLNVYSAAGIKNGFVLDGLSKERADEMKSFILQKIKDNEQD